MRPKLPTRSAYLCSYRRSVRAITSRIVSTKYFSRLFSKLLDTLPAKAFSHAITRDKFANSSQTILDITPSGVRRVRFKEFMSRVWISIRESIS